LPSEGRGPQGSLKIWADQQARFLKVPLPPVFLL
jgi:hypothetical protein